MDVSLDGKKVVVYDVQGPGARENICFDKTVTQEKWYRYSSTYLYEECLKKGIQLITADYYLALPSKPKAIFVRDRMDTDMNVSFALRNAGALAVLLTTSEQPMHACRFYWSIPHLSRYFENSELAEGVKSWVAPTSKFRPWYTPHAYWTRIRHVESNFNEKKFLMLMQTNARLHPVRRAYVDIMNFLKPMPNFENREGQKPRLDAIQYFSKYPDFDLYGRNWDQPVRYTHRYDEAIRKSYRGAPYDKFAVLQQYKFSIVFENCYLGGMIQEKIADSLYAGSVPIYWGAPDISAVYPKDCFIDFRDFDCDLGKLDSYLRNMDKKTYDGYIENINRFITSPDAYKLSQEHYASEMIKFFESSF